MWIATLLEYDLAIKLTKLIKGKSLAKLMAESNLHALDINLISTLSDEEEGVSLIRYQISFHHLHDMLISFIFYNI